MHSTHRASALELDLKRIVRAVLWTAGDNEQILGQALWSTDHNQWVVRAFDTEIGDTSLVVQNPATMSEIHDAITDVLDQIQNPTLAALNTISPALADIVRSLRTGT